MAHTKMSGGFKPLLLLLLLICGADVYAESFSELLSKGKEGSVFVIKENYNLGGTKVKIPANSTLRFDGGSLTNGTVVYQNTRIVGDPMMNVVPQGTIAGMVNINWFGLRRDDKEYDNGVVFNRVGRVFKYLYVEPGDYYCKTVIDWSNNVISNLRVDGNLHYIRKNTSTYFITIRTTRAVVEFNGIITGPTQNITDNNTLERSVGICFRDCNNSKVFLKSIGFFYKNIEVLGSADGYGNAYNDYEFVESYAGKVLVHLASEKKGWTSSNIFRMLRLTTYGGYTMPETGLLIQGEDTEAGGGFSDTVIEKLCIEGLKKSEPIKIIGANRFVINNIRNEDNYPTLCYCKNVLLGRMDANYGSVTIRPDNATYVGISTKQELDNYAPLDKSYKESSNGRHRLFTSVDANLSKEIRYAPLSYIPVGIVVSSKILDRPLQIQCGELFTLDVVYYDKNMKVLPSTEVAKQKPAGSIQFTKSNITTNGYMTSSLTRNLSFVCPSGNENVAYVGLFLRSNGASSNPVFQVSRLISESIVLSVMKN